VKGGIQKTNMKAISMIMIMMVLIVTAFAMPLVVAESNNSDGTMIVSENTEAGLEMNESASNGKIAWNQFKLWFTFNSEEKIEGELELAKLRLIQAKIAAKNNNSEAIGKAMDAHEKIMNKIQERINQLDGASDAEGLNASVNKLVGLERAIQVHESRIAYLGQVLETANLTDAQRAKIETKLQNMEENAGKLTQLQEKKMEQVKTKLMAVSNLTESEADALVEQKQEKARNGSPTGDGSGTGQVLETNTELSTQNQEEESQLQNQVQTQVQAGNSGNNETESEDDEESETGQQQGGSDGSGAGSSNQQSGKA